LSSAFGWPEVLNEPAATALPLFSAAETAVRFGFVLELMSSLLLVPAAYGLAQALTRGSAAVRVLTAFGVAGALFQLLGRPFEHHRAPWPVVARVTVTLT
jgi:hypothetical protein